MTVKFILRYVSDIYRLQLFIEFKEISKSKNKGSRVYINNFFVNGTSKENRGIKGHLTIKLDFRIEPKQVQTKKYPYQIPFTTHESSPSCLSV